MSIIISGSKLKALREKEGISVKKLCQHLGYSGTQSIYSIEKAGASGKSIKEDKAYKLCELLKVNLYELQPDPIPSTSEELLKQRNILENLVTKLENGEITEYEKKIIFHILQYFGISPKDAESRMEEKKLEISNLPEPPLPLRTPFFYGSTSFEDRVIALIHAFNDAKLVSLYRLLYNLQNFSVDEIEMIENICQQYAQHNHSYVKYTKDSNLSINEYLYAVLIENELTRFLYGAHKQIMNYKKFSSIPDNGIPALKGTINSKLDTFTRNSLTELQEVIEEIYSLQQ